MSSGRNFVDTVEHNARWAVWVEYLFWKVLSFDKKEEEVGTPNIRTCLFDCCYQRVSYRRKMYHFYMAFLVFHSEE